MSGQTPHSDHNVVVNVRWMDGVLEIFEADEVRFSSAYLWMRLQNGQNRHLPLCNVRWFSFNKESHEESRR